MRLRKLVLTILPLLGVQTFGWAQAVSAPTIDKFFGAPSINVGAGTTLLFRIENSNPLASLTGVAFTDTLPAGLLVDTPNGLTGSCGGTVTAVSGTNSISLAGGALGPHGICNFSVNVTATSPGLKVNITSSVTSTQGGTGNSATAKITVNGPDPDPLRVKYFGNLGLGESVINITNTGVSGSTICANAFVFSPDEQLIACCSCPVTPNALVSLGVKTDLINNALTPALPGSVTVKLLASSGTCNAATPGPLASGLEAWGTGLHVGASGNAVTEVPFTPATLSNTELARMTSLCGFIQANGSGYGVCRACRAGALGGSKQ